MSSSRIMLVFALTAAAPVSSAQDTKQQKPARADRVLFDFEDAGELAAWASAPEGEAGEKVKPK